MARVNSFQEALEIEKLKPKIKQAKIKQDQLEKNKIWEPIPNAPGNAKRLKK